MYDFIPSQTVREHARKTQHPFSDMDIAAIFYRTLPCGERTPALRELAARTENMALRRQIEERLAYETLLRERFESNDGSFFYAVAVKDEVDEIAVGHYASTKAALAAGKAGESPFCVSKYQFADVRDKLITSQRYFNPRLHVSVLTQAAPYFGQPVAEYHYDVGGALQMYWSEETAPKEQDRVEDWGAARFEERFVFLPNPFERDDIVCMADAPERVGVVETSREDWRTFLERAVLDENDTRKLLLEAAGQLLRGTGVLDELFWVREGYLTAAEGGRKPC